MKLSVIIVNYNVKYFLEQCLHSVFQAGKQIEMEVFVVDNNSVDGSTSMIKDKFPEVKLIENKDNKGFSKANNQAISISKGDYILLLNPDTVVEEDTFIKTTSFMDAHPNAGGLGVKMLDGKGIFLPESKRGLPTPDVAFYKIFGLSKLFPKSKIFGKYHLGYLDKEETNKVDILSGAFMLMRKSVLDQTGYLDEAFFMYGEDIDLSYRITLAGYDNYYFPHTRIIHYKGESTKKSSINYVFVFYNAMIIFAQKHFSQKNARLFSYLIRIAIYFRASIAIAHRFIKRIIIPILDTLFIYTGFIGLTYLWEKYILQAQGHYYPQEFILFIIPSYIIVWLTSILFSAGYDKPVKISNILKGVAFGTLLILIAYALLPETIRFSRALILLGSLWTCISITAYRLLLSKVNLFNFTLENNKNKHFAIIGSAEACEKTAEFIKKSNIIADQILYISPTTKQTDHSKYIGSLSQLDEIIHIHKIDEIIFCAKDLSPADIIDVMSRHHQKDLDFKIAPPENLYIIGSNSIHTSGDLYIIDTNAISKTSNIRNKRTFDILAGITALIISPFYLFKKSNLVMLYRNIIQVLFNKKSWVGFDQEYIQNPQSNEKHTSYNIKKGILSPSDLFDNSFMQKETINRLNLQYAKNYRLSNDIRIWLKNIFKLDKVS